MDKKSAPPAVVHPGKVKPEPVTAVEKRPTLLDGWHDFCQNVTMHGVRIVGDPEALFARRICWSLILLSSFISVWVGTAVLLRKLIDPPIETSTSANIENILTFPAVTLCNLNPYRKSYENLHPRHTGLLALTYAKPYQIEGNVTFPGLRTDDVTRYNVTDIIMKAGHSLSGMFFRCAWQGIQEDCSRFFVPVITSLGNCYTFNYDGNYTAERLEDKLSLHMSIQHDEYSYGATEGMVGVQVMVEEPGKPPNVQRVAIIAAPGTGVVVGLTKYKRHLSERQSCVTEADRVLPGCYDRSISHCVLAQCGCVLVYHTGNYSICETVAKTWCAKRAEVSCDRQYSTGSHQCGVPCNTVDYQTTVTYGGFPHKAYIDLVKSKGIPRLSVMTDEELRADLLSLTVFYETHVVQTVTQEDGYSASLFIGDVGGTLGLCLGASVITVMEVFEFIFRVLLCRFRCAVNKN